MRPNLSGGPTAWVRIFSKQFAPDLDDEDDDVLVAFIDFLRANRVPLGTWTEFQWLDVFNALGLERESSGDWMEMIAGSTSADPAL